MSCEQRENGIFNFKQSGYTQIMRSARTMFQALENYHFEVALCIYDTLKKAKIKKNPQSAKEFIDSKISNDRFRDYATEYMHMFGTYDIKRSQKYDFEIDHECINLALDEIFRNKNNTMLKPRRTAYPKLTNKDKSFHKDFSDLIAITFDAENKSFEWSVRSGNRTVDRANYHYVTKVFFKIVSEYDWKIGERGETICISESFDDDPCTPDQVPETTRSYEKLSKKQIAERKKIDKLLRKNGIYSRY